MLGRVDLKTAAVIAVLLTVVSAGCQWHDHSTNPGSHGYRTYVEDLEYPLNGAEVSSIDARTINGTVEVTGNSGTRGIIRVQKKVRAESYWEAEDFAHRVRIHFERIGDAVRVYATYPETPHGVSVEVGLDIECPRDTDLALGSVNGRLVLNGMVGGVRATTVNGSIDAEIDLTRRDGLFSTTNGSIDVRLGACQVPMTASTVNGTIDLVLPGRFAGLLNAQTVNGRVHSSVTFSDVFVRTPTNLYGRIGTGRDTPIALQAVNGNIRVGQF